MKLKQILVILLSAILLICSVIPAYAEGDTAVTDAPAAEETPATEEACQTEQAEWTVMIYLCGTDLESKGSMATVNLKEIDRTTPNESVNVVIQTGGTKQWHAQELGLDIDPDKTQRYHYDENGFTLDEELPLQNMASPDTLADFVQYSAAHYPAKKYLLVLWDHGGGSLSGLILDERYGAIMSLEELELALTMAGVPLEATLLDTCMMANLETAQALQSSSHYLIASEETVPGRGSDFYSWLQFLYDMPECNGVLFGRKVCDSAQQKYAVLGKSYNGVTFSVIDLTKLDPVTDAFNLVFEELRYLLDDPVNMLAFSSATSRTESYSQTAMIDLGDLVSRARGLGVSNKTANALLTALADAVVYNVRGVDHSYSTGLSFYYNPIDNPYRLDHYARFSKNAAYLAFIDRVNTTWSAPAWVYSDLERLPDITYDNYIVETKTEVTEDGQLHLTITNGVGAVQAIELVLYSCETFTDGDGTENAVWTRLGHDPFGVLGDFSTGKFAANISGKEITISGNLCEIKVASENSDYTLFQVPVRFENGDTYNLLVIYRYDQPIDPATVTEGSSIDISTAGTFEILGIERQTNNALPSRAVYDPNSCIGTTLIPIMTRVDFPTAKSNGTIERDAFEFTKDLAVEEVELPAGRYAVSFCVRDLFGKTIITEMVPFSWDGENAVFETESADAGSESQPAA